jgi:aminoglycoside phosphotransferase (APT) family kinase protein
MHGAVRRWVEATVGGSIVAERRPPIGGSRAVFLVDIERADGTRLPLVVRCEGEGSFTGTEVSLAREALVYRALARTPVPTPDVVACSDDGTVLLLERLAGTSELSPIGTEERNETMRSFVDAIATLHALDIEELDLADFTVPRTPADHARLDLARWARLGLQCRPLDPLLRYAAGWLWEHAPRAPVATVLVQGDTGPGNFLAEDGRVTGLVDWEFAHLGDPMDDWAWIAMRADAAELPALHARYTARSGIAIDLERVAYYRLAVDYRCAVTTSLAVRRGAGARGWAPYLLATQRFLDGLATRLRDQVAVASAPTATVRRDASPRTPFYDELLAGVRAAVAQLEDDDAREQTRNLQIFVRYLRAFDRFGGPLDAEDLADRQASLGADTLDDARLGDLAEQAGRAADATVLAYLLRRHDRRRQLWAELLDRPARA